MTWDKALVASQVHPNWVKSSKRALTYCVSLHEEPEKNEMFDLHAWFVRKVNLHIMHIMLCVK